MAVTDTAATGKVVTALGGTPEGATALEMANWAGNLLGSMRHWRWARALEAGSTQLDLVQDQPYVFLPDDCRDVIGAELIGETSTEVTMTSWSDILELRARDLIPSERPAWACMSYRTDATDSARLKPALEIHPEPTTAVSPGISVFYTKRNSAFFTLADNGDEAPIPAFMDLLYLQLVAAVARGWEDDLDGPGIESVYIEQVMQGMTYRAAVKADSDFQPTVGPVRHGFMDTARTWGPYVPPVQL